MTDPAPKQRSALWRLQDWCEAKLLLGLSWIFQRLPDWLVVRIGLSLGRLWWRFDSRRRRATMDNLALAYGDELSDDERVAIARGAFRNTALTATEFLAMPGWTRADTRGWGHAEGREHMHEALKLGKGAVVLGSHFGNWELTAAIAARGGEDITAVAKPMQKPQVDKVITAIRESTGVKIIRRKTGGLEALRVLRRGGVLGIVADQHMRTDCVFVEFFGKPCATTPAPAWLALKMGVPVLPVYFIRHAPRKYTLLTCPPIPIVETGDFEQDLLINTQRFAWELERMVRKYPENWLWLHRRWKTQPPPGWTPPHVPKDEAALAGRS